MTPEKNKGDRDLGLANFAIMMLTIINEGN
jgi:hypothetical protein